MGEGSGGPEGSTRLLDGESKGELGVSWKGEGEAADVVQGLSREKRGNGKTWGAGLSPVTGNAGSHFLLTSLNQDFKSD